MPYDPTGFVSHPDELHRGQGWKRPCRAATTANITISTALNNGDTLDGLTLATGDRVLVKDQTAGAENGIYIVGVTPVRAYDLDQDGTTAVPAEESLGAMVKVIAGTVNANTLWQCTNTTAPTLGTTALVFTQFSGGGASFATPAIVLGTTAAAGAAATLIRSDSTIAAFDATVPVTQAFSDAAATGSVAFAARRDHKHGMPAVPVGGGARAYNSGTVAVAASTETIVTLDSERSDSNGFHSTSSNTGRMTIPTGGAGRYSITGTVEWAASALGTLRRLSIRLNGTTYIAKDEITSIINVVLPQTVTTIYDLADADYVELIAFQDTAGSVNLAASGNYSPEFAITLGGASGSSVQSAHGCRATRASGNVSVGNNTLTIIGFNQEDFDTDTIHDNTTNPSRFTIPSISGVTTGLWEIIAFAYTDSTNSAGSDSEFRVNAAGNPASGTSIAFARFAPTSGLTPVVLTAHYVFTAADYVEWFVRTVGVAGNLLYDAAGSPVMSIAFLGKVT